MPANMRFLLVMLGLLAVLGAGLVVLATIGDASTTAATGGVYGALEKAGQQENTALRNDLYDVVLLLRGPWAIVQLSGTMVLVLSLVAMVSVWRKARLLIW